MPSGRRTPLVVASAGVALACAAAPWLAWLTVNGRAGHCGWTCPVPAAELPPSDHMATLAGRTGTAISPALAVLLLLVAVLAVVTLVAVLRAEDAAVGLGRVLVLAGFVALLWTVVLIVRYAEGGTMIVTSADGVFAADLGPGAIAALAGAAGGLLTGGAVALGTSGVPDPRPEAGRERPGREPARAATGGSRDTRAGGRTDGGSRATGHGGR